MPKEKDLSESGGRKVSSSMDVKFNIKLLEIEIDVPVPMPV